MGIRGLYRNACFFLKAATIYNSSPLAKKDENWMVLHSALKHQSCPRSFCKLILSLHPGQVLEKDDNGDLPIHIICGAKESNGAFECGMCSCPPEYLIHFHIQNGANEKYCFECFEAHVEGAVSSYRIDH